MEITNSFSAALRITVQGISALEMTETGFFVDLGGDFPVAILDFSSN